MKPLATLVALVLLVVCVPPASAETTPVEDPFAVELIVDTGVVKLEHNFTGLFRVAEPGHGVNSTMAAFVWVYGSSFTIDGATNLSLYQTDATNDFMWRMGLSTTRGGDCIALTGSGGYEVSLADCRPIQ